MNKIKANVLGYNSFYIAIHKAEPSIMYIEDTKILYRANPSFHFWISPFGIREYSFLKDIMILWIKGIK